jgi:hypothetical protein
MQLNPSLTDTNMQKVVAALKSVHELMSIPLIDVYGTCGINGLNRTRFITDTIHPYSVNGSKAIARSIGSNLNVILPIFN